MSNAVKISGRQGGLEIVLEPAASFGKIVCATEKRIDELKKFLKNSDINITFSGKRLTEGQKALLQYRIWQKVGENVKINFEAPEGIDTQMRFGVVRSGTRLKSSGNLVVLGDVNPGAYLIAAGSIVVMGSLKGVAFAGCDGDGSAFVAANDMRPSQIRIASAIARPPGTIQKQSGFPEIASLCEGKVEVKRLKY